MVNYSVELKQSARRELDALEDPVFRRIDSKLQKLAVDPRPPGCKRLKGYKDLWRLRVGEYRIVYVIDDKLKKVFVIRVGHRRDSYTG